MREKQETIDTQSTINAVQRRLIAVLIGLISIGTLIFIVHAILSASMNYQSGKANILAYFTIQSNIIIGVWLLFVALYIWRKKRIFAWSINVHLSAVVTTYIIVTGVIYWVLLVPIYINTMGGFKLFSASNIWLHTTTPIACVFIHYYIKCLNAHKRYRLRLFYFYIYPALYMGMAVLYAVNHIYLYPVFNPAMVGGWLGVFLSVAVICVIFTGVYILLVRYNPFKKFEAKASVDA